MIKDKLNLKKKKKKLLLYSFNNNNKGSRYFKW